MKDAAPLVVVPRITTARLLLREFRTGDFDGYAENLADPAARQLLGVHDRRTAWRMFAASTGFWMLHGAGWWGVARKETDELVGSVGAFYREASPELEIGWMIYRPFWRRGFATEAAAAALAHGFEGHKAKRIIAHISAANVASVCVSQHLGMRYETDVDLFGEPIGRYAVERP